MKSKDRNQTKIKVLMLGWEFPPILNGGLGVACHGLCNELQDLADITLIIPKSKSTFMMKNMELIGLDQCQLKFKRFTEEPETTRHYHVDSIKTHLSPYKDMDHSFFSTDWSVRETRIREEESVVDGSVDLELYGNDMMKNVGRFAHSASLLADDKTFDLIHAHDWMTFPAGMAIKSRTGKPLALHVHSLETDRNPNGLGTETYNIEKEALENADVIFAVSSWTKFNIVKHYHIKEEKIFTVHNGINGNTPIQLTHLKNFKTALFLGRLTFQKGPEIFIKIAKKVLSAVPDIHFVIAGTGDKFTALIDQAISYNISNRIHFTGFLGRESVKRLLSVTDVYVMPSISEPFGLSALEAAQQDVPCIVSRQSGVGEVLNHALKADYWDIEKIADYIIAVVNNKALKEELVANTKKDLEKVDWHAAASKTHRIYQQLINH
ncbi:glycosyltransferase family 4 protein [Fulvivirgaceae bacterium BMA12]|uniref:Glycosyltransferase family 4 protein n=1 Tax=Agaribacillus aureus TaxID=3051825 RepID=A0ABT8LG81_9BACT|nr:glycosyltransferase family 4 protein [Fulvivirgaceae bacterium BMA12]